MASAVLTKINDILKGKAPMSASRSNEWPKVRDEHLKNNPTCVCCGGTKKLEVHHIQPFHLHPSLELEPSNLITLCEDASNGIICHLCLGHLGNYKSFNKDVVQDAKALGEKIATRPLAD
jgi:hypothetical protein